MAIQKRAEPTFLDAGLQSYGSARLREFYDRMERLVPWGELTEPIRALPEYRPSPAGGRPAVDPEVMLKCIMVAQWNDLSDQRLEDQLYESISLRRFVGLSMDDPTPDSTSFCTFRQRLASAGLLEQINARLVECWDTAGVMVKKGTLVDATFIESPKGGRGADGTPTRDPEAAYAAKAGKPHFGYKAHIAADRSGIITGLEVTHANVHDGKCIDALTTQEKVAVYADSCYHQRERRELLRARGVIDGIMYQRRRGQAELTPEQRAWNAMVIPIRVTIEHVLGRLKQMIGPKTRFRGRAANRTRLHLAVIAANMRQGVHLIRTRTV
jgi:IS5 family transposase